MNVRKIRVKNNLISNDNSNIIICQESDKRLTVPMRVIIRSQVMNLWARNNNYSEWLVMHIDNDFFKDIECLKRVNRLKSAGHLFMYGVKKFGVDFDAVIDRVYSRSMNFCFYCDETLSKDNRTTEHLIPKAMLRAYFINVLEDNTVPCCDECNKEKANLHPYTFREYVKLMIGTNVKYKKVLKVLDSILISKTDPLA